MRSFKANNLFGVDIDPFILDVCAKTNVPGIYSLIRNGDPLPFPSNSFSHVIAYSVFTHLPENIMSFWISELSRVMKHGGLFMCTVEPPRFLDFVASIPSNSASAWHRGLRKVAGNIDELRRSVDNYGYAFIPTGGGGSVRTPDVYGDTVLTSGYIESTWSDFQLIDYLDDPQRFWQAVVTMRKL
jgi:SAM-dependent methyltransferase